MDILCLSDARWSSPLRARHLMTRFAAHGSAFFLEPPMFGRGPDRLEIRNAAPNVVVLVPWLASSTGTDSGRVATALRRLLRSFLSRDRIAGSLLWYCSPSALTFAAELTARLTVYDCAEELPSAARAHELELLRRADLVFTAASSLHEAKRHAHARVHLCPSGVDLAHFARARAAGPEPSDQRRLPRPRVGYAGVIDERLDLGFLAQVARARPELQFVMLGPVTIDRARLPDAPNLHWLGKRSYEDLPRYLSGWDAALVPKRARGGSARAFCEALEYLAAGRPVVCADAATPELAAAAAGGLVFAADDPIACAHALDAAIAADRALLAERAERVIAQHSWDRTAARMHALCEQALRARAADTAPRVQAG